MIIKGEIDNIHDIYYGLVDIKLNQSGIYMISGDNGIGKTTFIEEIIFGKNEKVYFSDETIQNDYYNFRYKIISYLPQNIPQPSYKISDYLANSLGRDKTRCFEYLKRFEFEDSILDKIFTELSGGEQLKIAFISTIMKDTRYLFLDEPTNNLDDASVETLKEIINELSIKKIIVIVSHDPRMKSLATSTIEFLKGSVKQVNVSFVKNSSEDVNVALSEFKPFLVARKIFLSANNLVAFLFKLILISIMMFLNGTFLSINYTTENPPTGGTILVSSGFDYVNEFNKVVINEMGLISNPSKLESPIEWDSIQELAMLEEVDKIVMTDFVYWQNIFENSSDLLSDVFVVNPPSILWEGYDIWHWPLSTSLLSEGRFPLDGKREVTLSTGLLQAHFEMTLDEASDSIGKYIIIGEHEYEIVGISYNHFAVISHHPSENFGFYTFDFETFSEFTTHNIEYREELNWWNIYAIEPIFMFPIENYEDFVLEYLLTEFPASELFSESFSIAWMSAHNRAVVSELLVRNLIRVGVVGMICVAFTFYISKLIKPQLESWEIYYIDKTMIKTNYLKWILIGGILMAMIAAALSLFFTAFWKQILLINLLNVTIVIFLEIALFILSFDHKKLKKGGEKSETLNA